MNGAKERRLSRLSGEDFSSFPSSPGINASGAEMGIEAEWTSLLNLQVQPANSVMKVLPGLTLSPSCLAGFSPGEETTQGESMLRRSRLVLGY